MEEQSIPPNSEKKESFFGRIKNTCKNIKDKTVKTSSTIFDKSVKAKESMAGKLGKIDAENCTLKEALAKIEESVFAGTKILEDLDTRFMGSARKLRDQISRRTAKTIYERWGNQQEKEELKEVIELDYDDV